MPGIQEFYQTATSKGFARKNLFRITRISDGNRDIYAPDASGNLYLYAKEGSIPSRTIKSTALDYKSFKLNVPTVAEYQEAGGWSVQFFSDENYIIRNLFEIWSTQSFDEHTSTTSAKWWNSSLEMIVLKNSTEKGGNLSTERFGKKYTLKGIYPSNIGTIGYDVTDSGNIVNLNLTLGFQYVISES
jgi:hypothetical protein